VEWLPGISSTVWSIEPHTKAKHEILQDYLKAWFPILSAWSGRIIYLDGFAGPGVYSGGEPGSPVLAIETAVGHSLRDRFNEILFILIEKEEDRAAMLKQVLQSRFPKLPANMKYEVIGAEFAPTLDSALKSLEETRDHLAPTFAFLDPFGFSGFPMKLISRIMSYAKCEVLITFMERDLNRFPDEMRETAINELYGNAEWQKVRQIRDPEKRRRFLLDLYETQLKNVASAKYVRSFEMIGANNQPIYYMVFGTKHWKGLKVMKEAMWNVDRRGTYSFSDLTDVNQKYMIDYGAEPKWVPAAANMVYKKFAGKTVNGSEIEQFVITETPFLYRKSILKCLEKTVPPKIINVIPRERAFTYPEGCYVTFRS